jgi:hypothetical protein
MMENAIKMKAIQHKARDINDLSKFLDYEKLSLDEEGNVVGLDEQFKALKEGKEYLFESEEGHKNDKALNPSGGSANNVLSEKEKYYELQRQVTNNPNNRNLLHQLFVQKSKLR